VEDSGLGPIMHMSDFRADFTHILWKPGACFKRLMGSIEPSDSRFLPAHVVRSFSAAVVEERVVLARELEVPRSYWLAVASMQ
jgi:hypothetical protein